MKIVTLLSLVLSSLPMRCCDVRFLATPLFFPFNPLLLVISFAILGTCLDFAAKDRRVTEQNAALEKCPWVLRLCGLILDVGVLSYCFRTAPSILASQLMVTEELSQLCILLCFLKILCLEVSRCFLILLDLASAFID
jgi:hypothetical protein